MRAFGWQVLRQLVRQREFLLQNINVSLRLLKASAIGQRMLGAMSEGNNVKDAQVSHWDLDYMTDAQREQWLAGRSDDAKGG